MAAAQEPSPGDGGAHLGEGEAEGTQPRSPPMMDILLVGSTLTSSGTPNSLKITTLPFRVFLTSLNPWKYSPTHQEIPNPSESSWPLGPLEALGTPSLPITLQDQDLPTPYP